MLLELALNSLLTESELLAGDQFNFAPSDSLEGEHDEALLEEAERSVFLTDPVAQRCRVVTWVSSSKGRYRLRRRPIGLELVGVLRSEPKIRRGRKQWYDYKMRDEDGRIKGGDEKADELLPHIPALEREGEFYKRIDYLFELLTS